MESFGGDDRDEACWQKLREEMTPDEVVCYLREMPQVMRGFGETLRFMRPDEDIVATLRAFYLAYDPKLRPRSVTKRIQNWLADRNPPTNREEFFRCAFALSLSEAELNYLLAISDGYGIQYRDGREVVLAWFLKAGRTYAEAISFFESLPAIEPQNAPVDEGDEGDSLVTRVVRDSFCHASTLDELRECYVQNLERFGKLHARAYYYFERYLERLIQPESRLMPRERRYSIKTVMDTYLELKMPYMRNRLALSPVQRLIKQNWPNETAIKEIRSRNADVPRKLIILLYVVTENEGFVVDDLSGERGDSFDDRIRDHYLILNAILDDCGMAQLDVRNAFDWLVLYALGAQGDETMSERLEAVIEELYCER